MKKLFLLILSVYVSAVSAQDHAGNLKKLNRLQEAEKSIVLLNNSSGSLPVLSVRDLKIASVHLNFDHAAVFDSIANKYWKVSGINADTSQNSIGFNAIHDKLKLFNLVILELSSATPFTPLLQSFIKDMEENNKVIVVISGDGKNLSHLDKIKSPVVWYKDNTAEGASVAAQLIFGGVAVNNRLDAVYSDHFKKGTGFPVQKIRLGYSIPEETSLNTDALNGIDSIVNAGIAVHATPSAVILLVKDGKVIFHKAYGKHTYDGDEVTKPDDIYDLASITKVSATTPSIMRLYDKKQLSLDTPISKYIAITRDMPDKKDIKIREALLHEAGYTPYIKFYENLKPLDMSSDSSAAYPTKVADHYYLRANYFNEVMWPVTLNSKIETRGKFVYSDLSMYMMKEVVEAATHQKLNDYVLNEFYLPLGMQSTGFLPRNRFDKSRIVPTTENDNWFRSMLVQGYVDDPGAAMAGGVEGHAGNFANANDLAIFYQMFLNKGTYGGQKYYDPATIELFTSRQSKTSTRGLGFERISANQRPDDYRSVQAYGHSGYTGTYIWIDPKYDLIYVYLSNRVYPDDGKTYGPSKINVRSRVLDLYYKAIVDSKPGSKK